MKRLLLFAFPFLPNSLSFMLGVKSLIVNQNSYRTQTLNTASSDETPDSSDAKMKSYPLQKLERGQAKSDDVSVESVGNSSDFPDISQLLSSVSSVIDEVNEQTKPQPEPVPVIPTTPTISAEKLPAITSLSGVQVTSVRTNEQVDLSKFLSTGDGLTMLVLATYAADFNAVEYAQRLRFYLPALQERGITRVGLVLNCEAAAAKKLVSLTDLPTDVTIGSLTDPHAELFVDPNGVAGRSFGVGRGWRPDDDNESLLGLSPYVKLFGMLWGLGAWATLPAVIGGYIGNPFTPQPWIEDALAVGQMKDRWPNTALELDLDSGDVKVNKFEELPVVGQWKRRPLELATLRLQNMVDISIKNWSELAPSKEALNAGVLTQLGGCVIVEPKTGKELYTWRDPGICAVANFEDILKKIPVE